MKLTDDRWPKARPTGRPGKDGLPRELARLLPDEPRWIDLRGLLLAGRCDLWSEETPGRGFVAVSWDFPFAAVHGRPRLELIADAVAAGRAASAGGYPASDWQLLATPDLAPAIGAALPEWRRQGVVIHRLGRAIEPSDSSPAAEIRLLPRGHRQSGLAFDHVPEPSRHEYTLDWVSRRPMAVAIVDGRAVSFCYAAFTTERWWDVSVETLEPFRRRGLAAACFLTLAEHMAGSDKEPAWGAMLDNPASLGLAARLGFVRDSSLDGWSEPG